MTPRALLANLYVTQQSALAGEWTPPGRRRVFHGSPGLAAMIPEHLYWQAQVRAEVTVGNLRAIIAVILGVAFLVAVISPDPFGEGMRDWQIVVAGVTIAAYFLLGLATRAVAASSSFRPWMSWAFVACDVGFIMISLVLGVINLDLPPGFLISYPVIWLIPVVLAFGAIRYDPGVQIFITVLIVLGLIAVFVFAAARSGTEIPGVPFQLALLLQAPPNVMRLVMITLAGIVLVVATLQSRDLLRRAIAEAQRRSNLTRYFPPQIADWLSEASPDELRRGRRQTVAVLFADIRGFTARAEAMTPDALERFVSEFRRRIADAADAHNGVIDKFIGDGAMIVFGVPHPQPDDAENAVACALAIRQSVKAWSDGLQAAGDEPVSVGIGAHMGEVFCGAVGTASRLEFTVLGDTANVAARIEQETKSAGHTLMVSDALLTAAGIDLAAGDWEPLPTQTLRGRHQPITLYTPG